MILDRLLHHSLRINPCGNSYRLHEKLKAGVVFGETATRAPASRLLGILQRWRWNTMVSDALRERARALMEEQTKNALLQRANDAEEVFHAWTLHLAAMADRCRIWTSILSFPHA